MNAGVACFGRYHHHNVSSLASLRSYAGDIPQFLHNKPPKFIEHCLKRMVPSAHISRDNITEIIDGVFHVTSASNVDKTYTVRLASTNSDTAPWCDCNDWARFHLPCKHILSIFHHFSNWSWSALPSEYTSFPHFSLDPDLLELVSRTLRTTLPCTTSPQHADSPSTPCVHADTPAETFVPAADSMTRSSTSTTLPVHCNSSLSTSSALKVKLRCSLARMSSLSYRVTDSACIERCLSAVSGLEKDLQEHSTVSAPFLKPVRRKPFVRGRGSALMRRVKSRGKRRRATAIHRQRDFGKLRCHRTTHPICKSVMQ